MKVLFNLPSGRILTTEVEPCTVIRSVIPKICDATLLNEKFFEEDYYGGCTLIHEGKKLDINKTFEDNGIKENYSILVSTGI